MAFGRHAVILGFRRPSADMQKVATKPPLVMEIFSDCVRIKTRIPSEFYELPLFCMMAAEILKFMFQKGLNQLDCL